MIVSYSIVPNDDGHLIIKVRGKRPVMIYYAGKTRTQVTKDVAWHLRNLTDAEVNKDRLQNDLDRAIWQYVPKHKWY
jgi:hypothetical protein